MTEVRRSLVISTAQRAFSTLITVAAFVVLARLLTPQEIGLYSIASATIGIAQVVREFGVGNYLIQERDLTQTRIRTAFTISLLIAVFLGSLVLAVARPVSVFYREERLRTVLSVLALNFFLIPFGSIGLTLLRREMAFERLFVISTSAGILALGVSVTLALLGYGYWALVWSSVIGTAATSLLSALLSKARLAYMLTLCDWRRVVRFGSRATAVAVVTELSMNMNDLVIGKALGVSAVSLFSRAQGLTNVFQREFLGAIRAVATPLFAKAHRSDEDLEALHGKAVLYIAAVAWPFFGFLAIFPLEILRLVFGPQWDAAAPLVPIFCLAGAIYAPCSMILTMLIAAGRVDLALKADLLAQPMRIGLFLLLALFAPSLIGFALAYLVSGAVGVVIFFWLKDRAVRTRYADMASALLKSGGVTVLTLLVPVGLACLHSTGTLVVGPTTLVLLAAIAAAISWILASRFMNSPLYHDPFFVAFRSRVRRMIGM